MYIMNAAEFAEYLANNPGPNADGEFRFLSTNAVQCARVLQVIRANTAITSITIPAVWGIDAEETEEYLKQLRELFKNNHAIKNVQILHDDRDSIMARVLDAIKESDSVQGVRIYSTIHQLSIDALVGVLASNSALQNVAFTPRPDCNLDAVFQSINNKHSLETLDLEWIAEKQLNQLIPYITLNQSLKSLVFCMDIKDMNSWNAVANLIVNNNLQELVLGLDIKKHTDEERQQAINILAQAIVHNQQLNIRFHWRASEDLKTIFAEAQKLAANMQGKPAGKMSPSS